ncbi:MAG: sulfite exporter TauE/SafE family protein [Pseudomonadota bacterium]
MELDIYSLGLMAVGLLIAGSVAGILAGLLGVGGGIIIVPVLLEFFAVTGVDPAVRTHLAVGTSLATIIATSISSIRSHHKRGGVDWSLWRLLAPSVAIGVILGTLTASQSPGSVLALTFAAVALAAAGYLLLFPEGIAQGDRKPGGPIIGGCGVAIGALSTMIGIGGGTMTVPTLVFFGTPVRRAIGTSAAVGLIIAVIGCVGFIVAGFGKDGLPPLSFGYVSLIGCAAIVPTTVVTAPIGAWLAHRLSPILVKRLFAAFLTVAALRLIATNI